MFGCGMFGRGSADGLMGWAVLMGWRACEVVAVLMWRFAELGW